MVSACKQTARNPEWQTCAHVSKGLQTSITLSQWLLQGHPGPEEQSDFGKNPPDLAGTAQHNPGDLDPGWVVSIDDLSPGP